MADMSPTLDDLVTDYEQRLHKMVDGIRGLDVGDRIDSCEIAEVAAHLSTRSSHMRSVIKESIVSLANAAKDVIGLGEEKPSVRLAAHRVPKGIYEAFSSEIQSSGLLELTDIGEDALIKLLYFYVRKNWTEILGRASEQLGFIFERIHSGAMDVSKRAQTRILQEAMAPEARIKQLAAMDWQVIAAPDEGAVLPDCTSIAFDGKGWQPLLFVEKDALEAIILPLTPKKLAVGKAQTDVDTDIENFNKNAAESCCSFFLSQHKSEQLEGYIDTLGGELESSIKAMTGAAVSGAIREFLDHERTAEETERGEFASEQSWGGGVKDGSISYQLQLYDFGNREFANALAEELKEITGAFSAHIPLGPIDGFTFAVDYKHAVNNIERGFEKTEEIEPIDADGKVGMGMPLTILSEGILKKRYVMRHWVAEDLLGDDPVRAQHARAGVLHLLANGALMGLMANKYPSAVLSPIEDEFENFLHTYCSGIFDTYFCTSISTIIPDFVGEYEEWAASSLQRVFGSIPKLKSAYFADDDMDRFFGAVGPLCSEALHSMARLLGAYKTQEVDLSEDSAIGKLLTDAGLFRWAELFRSDLEAFDAGLESWADFEEIFFVHRHFERFAAQFGVIPDRHDGPGVYIHVPWRPGLDPISDLGAIIEKRRAE